MFSFRIWPKLPPNPRQLLVPAAVFFSPNMRPFAEFCDVKRFPVIAYCVSLIREIGCSRYRSSLSFIKKLIFVALNRQVNMIIHQSIYFYECNSFPCALRGNKELYNYQYLLQLVGSDLTLKIKYNILRI